MNKITKFLLILLCVAGMVSIYIQPHYRFIEIADQEGIEFSFSAQQHDNPNKLPVYNKNLALKIPAISHHVWVTSKDKPHEIQDKDIKFMLNTLKVLDSGSLQWQHILWVNDPKLIPKSIAILEEAGIQVRLFKELENDEFDNDIEIMIEGGSFAQASDIIRYLAIYQYGGVYFDTDYELFKPIDNLMQIYDFIGTETHYYGDKKDGSFDFINNEFFAAKKSHPILKEVINLVRRNLHGKNIPLYIKFIFLKHDEVLIKTGPMAFTVAIFKSCNQLGNNDMLFESRYFDPKRTASEVIKKEEIYGHHDLNGDWYGAR